MGSVWLGSPPLLRVSSLGSSEGGGRTRHSAGICVEKGNGRRGLQMKVEVRCVWRHVRRWIKESSRCRDGREGVKGNIAFWIGGFEMKVEVYRRKGSQKRIVESNNG